MAFTLQSIKDELKIIVGDLAEQFSSATSDYNYERDIENAFYELTLENVFLWNTREAVLSHTSGVMTAPTNLAKILYLSDTQGNEGYYSATPEEFGLTRTVTDRAITYQTYAQIPYRITVSVTTGAETIEVGTFSGTPSTMSFNLIHTVFTSTTAAWIPDRVRSFIVSRAAADVLAKVDSPDANLIAQHIAIAKDCLGREISFNSRRSAGRFKSNMSLSSNIITNVSGEQRI